MMRDFSFFTSLLGFGNDSLFEVLSCMRVPFEQITSCAWFWVLQVALVVKNTPADAGDPRDAGSTPGSGRSSGGGHGHLVRYSCLENLMDRGTWWAPIHGVTRSWTQQSNQAQPSMPDSKVFSPRPIPHLLPLPHSVGSRLGLLSASGLALAMDDGESARLEEGEGALPSWVLPVSHPLRLQLRVQVGTSWPVVFCSSSNCCPFAVFPACSVSLTTACQGCRHPDLRGPGHRS